MKVLIVTDLEGITGVSNIDMVMNEGEPGYQLARRLLMADTNAAIDGAFAGGAAEVHVIDGHRSGVNFILDDLDKRAVKVEAKKFVLERDAVKDYDAFISIGCHAKVGTLNAFLDHTQSSVCWFEYTVGGKAYGEIGQQAILSGAYDIPLVCVSGDKAACIEARELLGDIPVAVTKTAKERNFADCLPQTETLPKIFEAAKEGVSRYKEFKPYKIAVPTEVKVTFTRNDYCDDSQKNNPDAVRDGRTMTYKVEKIRCLRDFSPC